ncbi:MAG: fatty acid desaturase [Myxococcota bacterium]
MRQRRKLSEVIEVLPSACYENPTWKGLLWLARDLAIYAAVVTALIRADSLLLLIPLWVLAGLSISALFILGHDAAHGALFRSERLNYLLGQLAMLPSLHLYEAWCFGHNRIHHGHTTRAGMDYVWHPVTAERFAQMSRGERLAHRLMWSSVGGGLYYLRDIWWRNMVRFTPPERIRREVRRDRIVIGTAFAAFSLPLLSHGFAVSGSAGGALWMWVKVFGVPFLLWNYCIGIAVYVHHIAQDIPWKKRHEWSKFAGQVEGTTVLHVPRSINFFFHNIFLHVPHHVDMRIPFYGLPLAVTALREHFGDVLRERKYGIRDYLRTTRACKLFDFEAGVWRDYAGNPAKA